MFATALVLTQGASVGVSPIGKVLEMVGALQAKVIAEGEQAQKIYAEFAEWCEDRSKDLGFEVKTGKAGVESLSAVIAEETATSAALETKIEELSASIASNEADLKAATAIRDKEQKDFAAEEAELMEVADMLERAVAVLEREMAKGGASMMQLKNAKSVEQALVVMVQAMVIRSADAEKLTAFLQNTQTAEDSDSELGAPDAAVYEGQSGGIVDTMQDLMGKAQAQLEEARKKETAALQNYEMLKQSLMDEIKFGNTDMAAANKGLAASAEKRSAAQGDLAVTSKDLAAGVESKAALHHECMSKAEEFEVETSGRAEEVKALTEAKKIILTLTSGADADSFVQVASKVASKVGLRSAENFKVVRFVRGLAGRTRAPALSQLAARMVTVMHSKMHNPFGKVKGMITDMLAKLEDEASEDETKKAWCDKELRETGDKKSDKEDEAERLGTKTEQMTSESAELKEEVAKLQNELSKLAGSQAEMDKLRSAEKAAYEVNRADAETGVDAVKKAIEVLKEYYGKAEKADPGGGGAIDGILGLLEVVESDFSKELAEIISAEETAVSAYTAETNENEIGSATKNTDVKHKTKESASLDKASAETKGDLGSTNTQLDAVNEYDGRIQAECGAKPDSYEERAKRRKEELAGLKEALTILESETAFIQEQSSRHSLRGVRAHQQDA